MFESVERFFMWIGSHMIANDGPALCNWVGTLDDRTMISLDNSLVTFYRVVGSRRLIGDSEFDWHAQGLAEAMAQRLKSGGNQHSLLFGFRSSQKEGEHILREILEPSYNTAKRLRADADFLFDDKLRAMVPFAYEKMAVMALVTHVSGLSPSERKRWQSQREKAHEEARKLVKKSKGGQSRTLDEAIVQVVKGPPSVIVSRHEAACAQLVERLMSGPAQVLLRPMDVGEVLAVARRFTNAKEYTPQWRGRYFGDGSPLAGVQHNRRGRNLDIGPPIQMGRQVVTEKLIELFDDAEIVKRGNTYYGSVVLEQCPTSIPTPAFSRLEDSLQGMPWSVSMSVTANGLQSGRLDQFLLGIVSAAGDYNKSIRRGVDHLKEMERQGLYVAGVRMIFQTWADKRDLCVDRISALKVAVDSWGNCVSTNETGAPGPLLLSAAPGFSRIVPAPVLAAPIDAVARMTPVFKPSSIWDNGQMVVFTRDGTPYPLAFNSAKQNYWGTLVFAPTGSGKSFWMNMFNAGVLFSPGLSELPWVTVIDKGPSAKGVVMLAQAMLPENLRNQIVYMRPTPNDVSFAVNPFDTQLGCDKALPADRDFLMAILQGICPNLGPEGGKFAGMVVDKAYEMFSRLAPTAKRWNWSNDEELSAKLSLAGITFDENSPPRVYDVVDAFFRSGMIEEAERAQFHAVPTMSDLTAVLNSEAIKSVYGSAQVDGESIIKILQRNLISASHDYKIFFERTRHRSVSRFTVIDIEGMAAATSSEEGHRRFGLMMLFARRLGARNFFLHPSDMEAIAPPLYRDYHQNRVQKIWEQPKFLEYDEIHNAQGIAAVTNLLQKDAREGRKYNVVAILSSQDLKDFPVDLVKNCYNFIILGAGNAAASRELQETFDLTNSEINEIMTKCTSPGKFFGLFRTSEGMLSQLLRTKPGRLELWAYSTSAHDMALRNALYEKIGVKNALGFLAEHFPGGSAKRMIEEMQRASKVVVEDEAGVTSMVIGRMADKIEAYMHRVSGGSLVEATKARRAVQVPGVS